MSETARPRGLVLDWGGVLTIDVPSALASWAAAEGIPLDAVRGAFARWLGATEAEPGSANPVHQLERGELAVAEFERFLAEVLQPTDGHRLRADGLLERIFAHFTPAPQMTALVDRARARGVSTALLSNSWGDSYPAEEWEGRFDAVVISADVGMRKPEPEIYLHTCRLLGLRPEACVFVDDLEHNVAAAVAVGMIGVHHRDYERTAAELSSLFGCDLAGRSYVG